MHTHVATNHTKSEVLQLLFQLGLTSGGSFAIWRKPKSNTVEIVLNDTAEPVKVDLNLENLEPGFIVHPFADQADKKAFFIKANKYFSFDLDKPLSSDELPEWAKVQLSNQERLSPEEIREILINQTLSGKAKKTEMSEDKAHFIHLVQEGVRAIQENHLEKVVPARTKTISIPSSFSLSCTLMSMMESYPNAFINFFHLPHVGTWIGASPETLIETKGDIFTTMSLAGTQKATGDNPLKSVAWTQKEIEEQALVSRYIVSCFKKIRLREYEEHGPKTVLAGNLLHLKSDFRINMRETGFPELGSIMLGLLHPTSAVCGMPRREAHDFLQEFEGFDRSFFSGFIGPVNIQGSTSIYVNLRTASLHDNKATLYAGAGVTEDSDPEKEWEETELKCQIIGKFIQNPST
ncbi:chorismate-binding protein [Algoriphagus halophytocola]|uniref:Chorismate-binding protein n=1 Tax=Algoriphagus halophytocola TaxID=2991499 RepID=A0ABY6MLM3_9BACT|nr:MULTISPECIES: chorismate-binding protein [unclassified Algoriphagus]UZD24073.1 chorismate-binding protein [Algoriphagus sp. TR-M5]WBL41444.1 chorismate-binding protein [Algoriphagus sp. TR-M9]